MQKKEWGRETEMGKGDRCKEKTESETGRRGQKVKTVSRPSGNQMEMFF